MKNHFVDVLPPNHYLFRDPMRFDSCKRQLTSQKWPMLSLRILGGRLREVQLLYDNCHNHVC